jgi:PAS domain S-box-containing protein
MHYLQKELEKMIKEDESIFSFIQKYALDGIWYWDLENPEHEWMDDKFWITLGYQPGSFAHSPSSWQEIVHKTDIESAKAAIHEHLNNREKPYDVIIRYYTPENTIKWIRCWGIAIRDANGKANRMLGFHINITSFKETEIALEYQLKRFNNIIEGTDIGTWEWNVQTGETIFNEKWAEIIGYQLADLQPVNIQTWMKFAHPDDLEKSENALNKHFEGLSPIYECESRMLHKNGDWIWVLDRGKLITRTADGKPEWMSGSHQDITQKKEAQELNRIFIENAPSAICMLDKNMNYIAASKKWLSDYNLSYTTDQIIGKNHYELFPEIGEDWKLIHQSCLAGEEKYSDGEPFIRANGEVYWLRWKILPWLESNNEVGGIIMFSEDITRLRKMDELQNLLKITEDQNGRLLNFAHIVSHNLKSHTSNFSLILSLIEKQEAEIFKHPLVQLLTESNYKLNETIEHLNQVVQMNMNAEDQLSVINLKESIASAINVITAKAIQENVAVFNFIENDILIQGIPAYVDSIILNMLTNAIRYKSNQRNAFIKIKAFTNDKHAVLTIEDNGLGIDLKKHRNKIFGLYKTFHENKDSRGIGLFISKNQALSMHGDIEVESQPNEGSIFKIYFILAQQSLNQQ